MRFISRQNDSLASFYFGGIGIDRYFACSIHNLKNSIVGSRMFTDSLGVIKCERGKGDVILVNECSADDRSRLILDQGLPLEYVPSQLL